MGDKPFSTPQPDPWSLRNQQEKGLRTWQEKEFDSSLHSLIGLCNYGDLIMLEKT